MKLHRFINPQFDLSQKKLAITDTEIVHQIQKVLRMKKGDKLLLGDGKGSEANARVWDFGNKEIIVEIDKVFANPREPGAEVTLYASILKKDKMEWLAEKATEVGVSEIVPITGERTVKTNLRYDRLRKIVAEAAEQSGRGMVPVVREKMSLEEALEEAKGEQDTNFFFHTDGEEATLAPEPAEEGKIGVFVGPEGGWSEEEVGLAYNKDLSIVKMGELVFRGETAGVLASYLAFFIDR